MIVLLEEGTEILLSVLMTEVDRLMIAAVRLLLVTVTVDGAEGLETVAVGLLLVRVTVNGAEGLNVVDVGLLLVTITMNGAEGLDTVAVRLSGDTGLGTELGEGLSVLDAVTIGASTLEHLGLSGRDSGSKSSSSEFVEHYWDFLYIRLFLQSKISELKTSFR